MSDASPEETGAEDAAEAAEAAPAPAGGKKKKKIILIAGAAVLLLGGGGAGYMMLGSGGSEAHAEAKAEASEEAAAYVEVPAMTVNLRSPDGQPHFLKLRFVLAVADAAQEEKVKEKLPLILDAFQPFLRELRPEDLAGSAAVFRLKEELMVRTASVAGPQVVRDVLIQDLIQQ